jgi:hypothetical protein
MRALPRLQLSSAASSELIIAPKQNFDKLEFFAQRDMTQNQVSFNEIKK